MNKRILGIDMGTNSIGWAIVERSESQCKLIDCGVNIFQEGVAREKGAEKPAVQKRTEARSSRRHYFRRRLHKIELLNVLIANNMCPRIDDIELKEWRKRKRYPMNPEFLEWQRTDDNIDKNPYSDRYDALSRKFNLDSQQERYKLGRALYHLAQRRGFLSNRKDSASESDGKVKTGIDDLSKTIKELGFNYIGEYFYHLYKTGGKIRGLYTHRTQHAEKEFLAIVNRQNLPADLTKALHRAIFFQRPLKSQKGNIGQCTFERGKKRCAVSHPLFEEFRMLSLISNIKIKSPDDIDLRQLTVDEVEKIKPLFFRKSKPTFEFEEIARKIAGKGNYGFISDKKDWPFKFNYRMSTSISGCPVTAALTSIFGENWQLNIKERYKLAEGKTGEEIVDDIWHVLYNFDSDEKLSEWAIANLGLDDEEARYFSDIRIPAGYASLSIKALRKIIPYLRKGLRYDEAVFLANLDTVLPDHIKEVVEDRDKIERDIIDIVRGETTLSTDAKLPVGKAVRNYLEDLPGIDMRLIDRIYHPSQIDTYPEAMINSNGELLLGSPRTSSIRNPMAMRALFRLRHLVNRLLKERKIDRATRINIEFSRSLNDANMRKAIEQFQNERESLRAGYAEEIKVLFKEQTGIDIEPTENDILKYTLWEEQNHCCLYTGKQIGIADFLGPMPRFDIEHTLPRSLGGDNSLANKTLCDINYNRKIKRATLPALLADHEAIMSRIEALGWPAKIEELANQLARNKTNGYMAKDFKDKQIQKRHLTKMKLDYLRDKFSRFTMTEIPEGFSKRQGVDIGIIGKYAREYLLKVLRSENYQICTVNGSTTAEFRKMWGLQPEFAKKERINHCHHAIDAIVIACIGREEYRRWAEYQRDIERVELDGGTKPKFPKPWDNFTTDVMSVTDRLLISHHLPDNRMKQTRRKLRKRGRIVTSPAGQPIIQQGDTARAQLHKETFYGAIKYNGEIRYVIRTEIGELKQTDISKIVDPVVREKIEKAVSQRGFKNLCSAPVYMNEEKGVEIKKVRIFTPSVTSPIHLKKHRDLSPEPYKQHFHVANDSNYCMGIYSGTDSKGKPRRSFKLVNNLDAAALRKQGQEILPLSDNNDLPLRWRLKTGMMVLFYENSPAELFEADREELSRRLYKIVGLNLNPTGNGYGAIHLRHHQEARPSTDSSAKSKSGKWTCHEFVRPGILLLHTQFNALVEGQDFTLSLSGEISFNNA